ncbi:MAG: hypothetical protein IT378_01580 [Sandaracinaceae bacterium]|nr:hypothetical protein [Sandaracinaceae bacterium]
MTEIVSSARAGREWSFGELLFGLGDVRDVEGRPLGERRASSAAKAGCPIEMVACPYEDERLGISMNASALEQVKTQLRSVHQDIAAFHGLLPAAIGGWARMFIAVIDQLVSPGLYVLSPANDAAPIPARIAVGYKLAAGYFDVLRRLSLDEAGGVRRPPSLDAFLEYVTKERALLGGGGHEACAGPPKLIRRTSAVFLGEPSSNGAAIDPRRVPIATALYHQVQLGVAWSCLDEAVERRLFERVGAELRPRNAFMSAKLDERLRALRERTPRSLEHALAALVPSLGEERLTPLQDAIHNFDCHESPPAVEQIAISIAAARGGLLLEGSARIHELAQLWARHLVAYRQWLSATWSLEQQMRACFGLPAEAPMKATGLVLPASHASRWLEAIAGCRVEASPGPCSPITLRTVANRSEAIVL